MYSQSKHTYTHTHSPNRCSVLGKDLKVPLCQSQWALSGQLQLSPLGDEGEERLEEDQSQTITAVVGGVCHEDGDLREGGGRECGREGGNDVRQGVRIAGRVRMAGGRGV